MEKVENVINPTLFQLQIPMKWTSPNLRYGISVTFWANPLPHSLTRSSHFVMYISHMIFRSITTWSCPVRLSLYFILTSPGLAAPLTGQSKSYWLLLLLITNNLTQKRPRIVSAPSNQNCKHTEHKGWASDNSN